MEAGGRVGAGRIRRAREGKARGAALIDRPGRREGCGRSDVVDGDGSRVLGEAAVLVDDARSDGGAGWAVGEGTADRSRRAAARISCARKRGTRAGEGVMEAG